MLVLEVFRYLKRRADKRPVRLSNLVSMENHHGQRSVEPKVSIIIPTRDRYELLRACIESIQTKTTYGNFEIVVINNASNEASAIEYLKLLRSTGITVLDYSHAFNYSKISNFGADNTESEYLCFLNNDTEVIEPNWLGLLMDHATQPEVGVVGSKLLYPDGTLQHLGISIGYTGAAGHPYSGGNLPRWGNQDLTQVCFEVTAVTFACALISRNVFEQVGKLDSKFKVGLNDVDFAIRSKENGFFNVLCSKSCLIHHESKSRPKALSLLGFFRAVEEIRRLTKKHRIQNDNFFSQY